MDMLLDGSQRTQAIESFKQNKIEQTIYILWDWYTGEKVGETTDWKEVEEFLNRDPRNSYTEEKIFY